QPVAPGARHAGDVLLQLAGREGTFKDYLQARWRALHARYGRGRSFEDFWTEALQHGGLYTDVPAERVRLGPDATRIAPAPPAFAGPADRPVLVAVPSQVLPDTAARWAVVDGDVVLVESPFGAVRAPVWTNPAIRRDVLAVPTGQGHTPYGRYARERSFNAFDLLPAAANGYGGRTFAVRVTVRTTGEHRVLATLAGDPRELGEGIVRELPLSRARALAPGAHPFREALAPPETEPALRGWAEAQRRAASLGDYAAAQPRWGMAIDLA